MKGGRILAIDYGTRYIGLACCDELRLTVHPLPSLQFSGRRDLFPRLRTAVKEHQITELVVGIPFNMNGSSGASVRQVERFADLLEREFEMPLNRVDERLSTVEAMEVWRDLSAKQRRKYRTIDSLSAALILSRYLKEY